MPEHGELLDKDKTVLVHQQYTLIMYRQISTHSRRNNPRPTAIPLFTGLRFQCEHNNVPMLMSCSQT